MVASLLMRNLSRRTHCCGSRWRNSWRASRLTKLLNEQRRSGKRQAALFSKGPPKSQSKRPGRKPGDAYATDGGFRLATHQQCVAHLLKRCRELQEGATAGAVRFPRAVKQLLKRSLAARDRYLATDMTLTGLRAWATKFTDALQRLVRPRQIKPRQRTVCEMARTAP